MKKHNQNNIQDKEIRKVLLKEGERISGRVIGLKNFEDGCAQVLLNHDKEMYLLNTHICETKQLILKEEATFMGHKQGVNITSVHVQTIKFENINRKKIL